MAALRARNEELEATLDAIRSGAVDALVVSGQEGEQIFTLQGADQSYRVLVEAMNEGAVTISDDGTILYANTRFSKLLQTPLKYVLGVSLMGFVALRERGRLAEFIKLSTRQSAVLETTLVAKNESEVTVQLSGNPLPDLGVAAVGLVITDITHRTQVERMQRDLSKNILEVQEKERQRVARELHDSVNQLLSSTKHRLHAVESRLPRSGELVRGVAQARRLVERTINEIRAISRNLRPSELDDLGLIAAIRTLGDDFAKNTPVKVTFALPRLARALTPHIELTIYRIVQEALANVAKHARATRVEIQLKAGPRVVRLRVKDNGRGFSERPADGLHWGLINMRERASYVNGALVVSSEQHKGAEIRLQIAL